MGLSRHDTMWRTSLILLHLSLLSVVLASKWPYKRYQGFPKHGEAWRPNKTLPEFHKHPRNLFGRWLRHLVDIDSTGQLKQVFTNGSIPRGLGSFDNLLDHIDAPTPPSKAPSPFLPPSVPLSPQIEAAQLFKHLPYPIDPRCTNDRSKFWYRTYDGSCNWMKVGEISEGQVGTKKSRDYNQYSYADGISAPREGPNPRAVSNAFFKRKKALFYEHTPLMLGLIEVSLKTLNLVSSKLNNSHASIVYSLLSTTYPTAKTQPQSSSMFPCQMMKMSTRVTQRSAYGGRRLFPVPEHRRRTPAKTSTWPQHGLMHLHCTAALWM